MHTRYVPGVVELRVQETKTVALAVMLLEAGHVTVRPVPGLTVAVRLKEPAKF